MASEESSRTAFIGSLCRDCRNKLASLCTDSGREINPEALEEIVSFMRDDQVPTPEWGTAEVEYVPSFVRPERIVKALKAQRKSSSMTVCSDLNELHRQVASLEDASALDTVFLNAVANEFGSKSGALPPYIRCEVRQTRVSFFDSRVSTGSQRVARIELGKNQPDILLLTDLAVTEPLLEQLARPVPHDKGPHMRRYRLSEESQTLRFGHALADVLSR